jgi:hypothetical protein
MKDTINNLPFNHIGMVKKEGTRVYDKKLMDESWEYILNNIDLDMLWKLGVYTTKVYSMENNERGMFIERFFCQELDGENLDDATANKLRLQGTHVKHDFTLPNGLQINTKSNCVEKLYNRIGDMSSCKGIKIFDTSRNKYIEDQTVSLWRQLNNIGWDVILLFYGYEKSTNKCSLYLTSLREMSVTLLGDDSNDNIMKLFSYDKGGSHYFIDRANIYYTSKQNNRVYYSNNVDKDMVDEYIKRKQEHKYNYINVLS